MPHSGVNETCEGDVEIWSVEPRTATSWTSFAMPSSVLLSIGTTKRSVAQPRIGPITVSSESMSTIVPGTPVMSRSKPWIWTFWFSSLMSKRFPAMPTVSVPWMG